MKSIQEFCDRHNIYFEHNYRPDAGYHALYFELNGQGLTKLVTPEHVNSDTFANDMIRAVSRFFKIEEDNNGKNGNKQRKHV